MKRLKNGLILLFLAILTLLLLSCSERYKEPAPFFDKLHLEYEFVYYSPLAGEGSNKTIYDVQKLDNNHYKIIRVEKGSALKDEIDEFFVDAYGRVYKSSSKDYQGGFSPIWIPAYLMDIGDSVYGDDQVIKRDKWEKWNVVVVRSTFLNQQKYYEIKTGFLVGASAEFAGHTGTEVLVNTNANIPVVQ
jgi:hypothetical protein